MGMQQINQNFTSMPKRFPKDLEGQWIAVSKGKIVSTNKNFKVLFGELKEKGLEKKVLFHKVPLSEVLIL